MSLRKVLSLARATFRCTAAVHSSFYSRQNICLLTANSARLYSDKNLGQQNKGESEPVEKVDIIGRLFPKTQLNPEDAQEIKKEQEKFEKENREKSEENEKSWRRMKMGFAVFGGAVTVMGGCLVVEMGAPRRDDDGNIIEDEYSNLPVVLQYLKRTWKELTFYEKVTGEALVIFEDVICGDHI